jgi:hypothetical protein
MTPLVAALVRPPVACAVCHAPIRKFIPESMEWHPCLKCGGVKCEKCCDASAGGKGEVR